MAGEEIDFQSAENGGHYFGWGRVLPYGAGLEITYQHNLRPETFKFDAFSTEDDVEELRRKIRTRSEPYGVDHCPDLERHQEVCALFQHPENDTVVSFYDASIHHYHRVPHTFEDGVEECDCRFYVIWKEGPAAGEEATLPIGHLYEIDNTIPPKIDEFLNDATRRAAA